MIASCFSNGILVLYKSNRKVEVFSGVDMQESLSLLQTPAFTFKLLSDENISHMCLNEDVLLAAYRDTNARFFSVYEVRVFQLEEKAMRYLYTIPIWAEDVNDQAASPVYLTNMAFERDCLQYVYNHSIVVQRKATLSTFRQFSTLSQSNEVSNLDLWAESLILSMYFGVDELNQRPYF